jgi:hypothetical protein
MGGACSILGRDEKYVTEKLSVGKPEGSSRSFGTSKNVWV